MSNPNHMHEYLPRRKDGRCKHFVGGVSCGLPADAPAHIRWTEAEERQRQEEADTRQEFIKSVAEEVKRFTETENPPSPWLYLAHEQPKVLEVFIARGTGWSAHAYRLQDGSYRHIRSNEPIDFIFWMRVPGLTHDQYEIARHHEAMSWQKKVAERDRKLAESGDVAACMLPNQP